MTSADVCKIIGIMPLDAMRGESDRVATMGNKRVSRVEAGIFQFLAKFRLHLIDIFRAVFVGEARPFLECGQPVAFGIAFGVV